MTPSATRPVSERDRAVAGDPDRQRAGPAPRAARARALVLDRAALDERADDVDSLLQVRHRRRRLAQHAPRGVAATDAEVHPAAGSSLSVASAEAVTEGSRVAGFVTQVPRRSRVGRLGHQREQRIRIAPQDVASRTSSRSRSRPPRPACVRSIVRSIEWLRLEREPELHRLPPSAAGDGEARLPSSKQPSRAGCYPSPSSGAAHHYGRTRSS